VATNLYQGDFLAEDPYEEWTISIRSGCASETWMHFINSAAAILSSGSMQPAHLCAIDLERDRCREDVHCLLMRCYANQNQIPLALRQYQVCVEALRREMGC